MQMSFIRAIPLEIEEAAMIDGCSHFGSFIRIVLPLEITGIITTFIVCIIFAWNELPLSLVLAPLKARTLPVSILSWNSQRGILWGPIMAAGMMAVIPIILFGVFAQKYVVRGLTLGSISDE
jgi:ABC-type glycerol-3-phosphate transport system permease component